MLDILGYLLLIMDPYEFWYVKTQPFDTNGVWAVPISANSKFACIEALCLILDPTSSEQANLFDPIV